VHVDRNSAAVINTLKRSIRHESYIDFCAIASECLIDRVVDDFINQVVESAFASGSDIHSRTLSNRIQAFENCDV
jgi:hypothetical protein